jgi:Sec-independent protein translocase protein TatA
LELKAMMFGMPGPTELLIILGIVVLMFGAKNVPKVAGSLVGMSELQGVKEGLKEQLGVGEIRRAKEEVVQGTKEASAGLADLAQDLKGIEKLARKDGG